LPFTGLPASGDAEGDQGTGFTVQGYAVNFGYYVGDKAFCLIGSICSIGSV
jgi:hypothetical protein